jgi:hypothetical protein
MYYNAGVCPSPLGTRSHRPQLAKHAPGCRMLPTMYPAKMQPLMECETHAGIQTGARVQYASPPLLPLFLRAPSFPSFPYVPGLLSHSPSSAQALQPGCLSTHLRNVLLIMSRSCHSLTLASSKRATYPGTAGGGEGA